ncbi:hypothetical protein SDC9_140977 [bioreactor metagenome]|uniref:Uncharacterized protein n=1 Tax=bioreactor metagenome TaxID=1076179 RepID=A0A645DX02_9ZZZZ
MLIHHSARALLGHAGNVVQHRLYAKVDHLLHGAGCGKRTVLITIAAIIPALCSVCLGSVTLVRLSHRHPATLAVTLFHRPVPPD